MSKRICTSAVLLVTLLSITPVAAAAPTDRGLDDGLVEMVQTVWEDLVRFLGFGPEKEPGEPAGSEEPRPISAADNTGPHIDP